LLELSAREALVEVLLRKAPRRGGGERRGGGGSARKPGGGDGGCGQLCDCAALAAARAPPSAAACSSAAKAVGPSFAMASATAAPALPSQEHLTSQSFSRAHFEQSRPILLRRLSMKADLKE